MAKKSKQANTGAERSVATALAVNKQRESDLKALERMKALEESILGGCEIREGEGGLLLRAKEGSVYEDALTRRSHVWGKIRYSYLDLSRVGSRAKRKN